MTQSLLTLKNTLSPMNFASFLHAQGDIFWSSTDQAWVITSYELAKIAYTHPTLSADRLPYFDKIMMSVKKDDMDYFFKVVSKFMVMSDPPKHTNRRRVCYHAITHDLVKTLKFQVKKTMNRKIEILKYRSEFDLVNDFFTQILVALFSELFNVPDVKQQAFFEAAATMTKFFGGLETYTQEHVRAVNSAAKILYCYFENLIHHPSEFMHTLLQYQLDYHLSDDELISQSIMILIAGQVTTIDQASNIFNLYYRSSNQTKKNLSEQDTAKIVEEFSRLDPAVFFNVRIAKNDVVFSNKTISAGETILIANIAANYDAAIFSKPHQLDVNRPESKQLGYGYGAHFCLGSKIARMVLEEIFLEIQNNFSNWTLSNTNPAQRKTESLAFSGYKNLIISTIS